ncbi:glycoside hydrolase [Teratosphaeria nubilosa]|uniref:Glycoside hydrolase n=1 Tax=Teratosphaeria nubilosa TaxID=161662 RepID=A0A6G1KTK1_9PEZI|nr:glycoside hydrolase [Teratosphaeria nubilosa]
MWWYIVLLAVVVKAEQRWSRTAMRSHLCCPEFSDAAKLLPSNITYTTYSLDRNATALQDGIYGQGAYAPLWSTLSYNTTVPFTTIVSATPVAGSELIYPPPLYTACPSSADTCLDCYKLPANFLWGVAGSAWQIEGGLTCDGQGPSDLDTIGACPTRPAKRKQNHINTEGLERYEDVIETCLEYGITPIQVMSRYGDQVGHWVTINKPNLIFGTSAGADYSPATIVIMGHAQVYHWYKEVLGGTGLISLKFGHNPGLPFTTASENEQAANRYQDFLVGALARPLFWGDNYLGDVLNTAAPYALAPPNCIDACTANASDATWPVCVVNTNVQQDGWLVGQASVEYAYIAPQYVRQQLDFVWNERVHEDGVNEIGALAWSFMDNNGFGSFANQYGMQHLNRTDGVSTRTYKRSFFDFVDFFREYVG